MEAFETRRIGRTAIEVTTLGLGCATLGGTRLGVGREEAEAIVRAAWAGGVRYIDTAPYYGFGQAERCVGDAMRGVPRDNWVLSTKVGRLLRPRAKPVQPGDHPMPFEVAYDYSYDGIMRSFEDSLQRLGLARIDILYVHDIGARTHGRAAHPELMRTLRESGYRALEGLRAAGTVRAIGIGVNEREVLLEALEWGAWDVFLLAGRYTLLEQTPIEDLLPKCVETGVINRGWRATELRHSRRARNLELRARAARDHRPRRGNSGGLRQKRGAACRRCLAIPAGPSGGRSDHPGTAQRRRVRRQSRIVAAPNPRSIMGGAAARRIAPSAGADAELAGRARRRSLDLLRRRRRYGTSVRPGAWSDHPLFGEPLDLARGSAEQFGQDPHIVLAVAGCSAIGRAADIGRRGAELHR